MPELTIPQAAAALGVSVDTVRRRIKSGRLDAVRNDAGTYIVDMPAATPGRAPAQSAQQTPSAQQTRAEPSEGEQRRRISDYLGDLRGLRELLDVERKHSAQLLETLQFQRRQLEQAEVERRRLVAVIETLQQHFGIEQLQRILGEGSSSRRAAAVPPGSARRRGEREGGA